MFCGKCGNKNEANMKFCGSCGAPIGGSAPDKKTVSFIGAKEIVIGPIKLNAPDENNATISIANKTLKASLIFKVASVLLAIAFFMPFFSIQIRLFGITAGQSMNGWTTTFGYEGASGSFMAILLLLIPVVIFVLFHFTKQLEEKIAFIKGKLFLLSTGGFALGFIVLFLVRSSVNNTFQGNIGNAAGFWLTLIFYLVAGAVSAGCLLSAKGVDLKIGANESKTNTSGAVTINSDATTGSVPIQTAAPKQYAPAKIGLPIYVMATSMGASVLMIVAFFLNWIKIEIGDIFGGMFGGLLPAMDFPDITMNGWNMLSGNYEEELAGIGITIFFILIPIAQLALFALQKTIKLDNVKLLLISTALFAIGVIMIPIFISQLNAQYYDIEYLSVGFYMSAALFVLSLLASIFFLVLEKKAT